MMTSRQDDAMRGVSGRFLRGSVQSLVSPRKTVRIASAKAMRAL